MKFLFVLLSFSEVLYNFSPTLNIIMPLSSLATSINVSGDEGEVVSELPQNITKMAKPMTAVSRGLRLLNGEYAVSNADNVTSFRKILDGVRTDADIYCKKILPLVIEVVLNISQFFENYLVLDFEDWHENLNDIIEDVEKYENACEVLSHLHKSMMTNLKKHKDEAMVSTDKMQQLSEKLRKLEKELKTSASAKEDSANLWNIWVAILAIPTLGIFTAIASDQASECRSEAKQDLAQAVANQVNAEINTKAAWLTQEVLIPSVEAFLEGLNVCQAFFAVSKGELIKMRNNGTTADGKRENPSKMKRHFSIMKKNGVNVEIACKAFISSIGEVCKGQNGFVYTYY